MSTDKNDFSQTENGAGPYKRTKKQALKDHLKKFWWLHLIIFLCLVVIGVTLTIFVGVPRIAQTKVNQAKLRIQSVSVLNATNDKFLMVINSTISTDGTIKAQIDGFQGRMYLPDAPNKDAFVEIPFPATNANKHQNVNVAHEITITNRAAFDQFNLWFANNETLRVTIEGRTQVKPAGLFRKWGVDFKKTVDVPGLNFFKGTTLPEGKLSFGDGYNFEGTADISNPSYFTLDVGNTEFINYADNVAIGNLTINNLFLRPGNNSVPVKAMLDQVAVAKLVTGSGKYCKTGIVPLQLQGKSVNNHGENITYFADALASGRQTVDVNVAKIIGFKGQDNCS